MIRRIYSKREDRHVWQIDLTIEGQRIRQAGYDTRREATEAVAALKLRVRALRLGLEVPDKTTIGALLTEWRKTETRKPRLKHVAAFVDFVGAHTRISDIRTADLRRYQFVLAKTLAPGTIQTYLSYVTSFLNSASLHFQTLDDYRAPLVPTLGKKGQRDRLLGRGEITAILRELRAPSRLRRFTSRQENRNAIADLMVLLLLTGARVGELLAFKPALYVDWERSVMTIRRTKTGSTSIIPIGQLGRTILQRHPEGFPFSYPLVRDYFKRVSDRLGLVYGDRTAGGWVIHDLRHTVASLLAESGINESVIAELLGHKKRGTTGRIYTHATMPALRKAVEVLEEFCRDFDGEISEDACFRSNSPKYGAAGVAS